MLDKGRYLDLLAENAEKCSNSAAPAKPFLGVHFACCGVYARVVANAEKTAYLGHCPRCARRVRFEIGPGGSDSRFFTVQ